MKTIIKYIPHNGELYRVKVITPETPQEAYDMGKSKHDTIFIECIKD